MGTGHSKDSHTTTMGKSFCLVALLGLASSAPNFGRIRPISGVVPGIQAPGQDVVGRRLSTWGSGVSTQVVDTILKKLDKPIDDAIQMFFANAQAGGGLLSNPGTFTTGSITQGPVNAQFFEGTHKDENSHSAFQGFSSSNESSFSSHSHSGSSGSSSGSGFSSGSTGSSSGIGLSSGSSSTSSEDQLINSVISSINIEELISQAMQNQGSSQSTSSSFGSSGFSSGESFGSSAVQSDSGFTESITSNGQQSSSSSGTESITSNVVTSLLPAIQAAVQQALLASSSSTFGSQSNQASSSQSGFSSVGSTSTVQSSEVAQQQVVRRIIKILQPKIIELVTLAIQKQETSFASAEASRQETIRREEAA